MKGNHEGGEGGPPDCSLQASGLEAYRGVRSQGLSGATPFRKKRRGTFQRDWGGWQATRCGLRQGKGATASVPVLAKKVQATVG